MSLALAWALLAPLALGALLLRALGASPRRDAWSFAAWTWPLGCLVLAAGLWLAVATSLPTGWWAFVPLPLLALLAFAGRNAQEAPTAAPRANGWLRAATAMGLALCAVYFASAMGAPCLLGDEANLWATKAKSLWLDWYAGEFAAAQRFTPHPDYPLWNPLLQAWIYSACGEVVHFENRWLVLPFSASMLLAVAAAVRRRAGDAFAALCVLGLALEPEFAHLSSTAYADGMVGLGLVLLLDGWLREQEEPHRLHRALAALGATFALGGKNEATLYVALAVAFTGALFVLRKAPWPRLRRESLWWGLPALWFLLHTTWNRTFGLSNDLFGHGGPEGSVPQLFVKQFGERIGPVCTAALQLFDPRRLHVVLLLPFLALLLARRHALARPLFAPTLAIVAAFVVLHLIYVGSYLVLSFHLETSQRRVLFQLVPVTIVWTAALVRAARANDLVA